MTIRLGGRKNKKKKKKKKNNYRILTQKSKFWKPFCVSVTNFHSRIPPPWHLFMVGGVLEFTEVDTVINFKMVVFLKRGLNGQWKGRVFFMLNFHAAILQNFAFAPVSNLTILNPYTNRRNFRVCHGLKFRGEVPVVRHFDTDNSQGQPSPPLPN